MSDSVEGATSETEKEKSGGKSGSTASTQARAHALEDARRVVDLELQSVNDLTRKAWRVVRFNGLVATVFAALVPTQSGLDQLDQFSGGFFAAAIIALGFSTYIAYRTQKREKVKTGPESGLYRALANHEYDEDDYLSRSLEIHADCLDSLNPTTEEKSENLDDAIITSVLGVILLLAGTLWLFIA
jgi:hypothetical protein